MGLFDLLFNDDESSKNNKELSLIDFLIMNDLEKNNLEKNNSEKNKDNKEDYEDFQFEEELEDDDFFFEDDLK